MTNFKKWLNSLNEYHYANLLLENCHRDCVICPANSIKMQDGVRISEPPCTYEELFEFAKRKINVPMHERDQIYHDQIEPLIDRVAKICNDNKIPFLCTFSVDDEDKMFRTSVNAHDSCCIHNMVKTIFDESSLLNHGYK